MTQAVEDKLHRSFLSYSEYAKSTLGRKRTFGRNSSQNLQLAHIAPSELLRSNVEFVEHSPKFGKLASDYYVFLPREFAGEHQLNIGEEDKGVGVTIRNRLATILSKTEKDRKTIRKKFDDLYAFRSSLVHGKGYRRKAQAVHLADARFLARHSILWFFEHIWSIYTQFVQKQIPPHEFPRREELLAVLDFDNQSMNRLRLLIENPERSIRGGRIKVPVEYSLSLPERLSSEIFSMPNSRFKPIAKSAG